MKLRNKKTGKVGKIASYDAYKGIFAVDCDGKTEYYYTLAELNDEWEDYKPEEPLIKDEKIRKAVRAWAEALGLQEVYCASNGYEVYGGVDDYVIQFEGEPFPFADRNKIYSIAELCGTPPEPIEPTFIDLDERIKEKEK